MNNVFSEGTNKSTVVDRSLDRSTAWSFGRSSNRSVLWSFGRPIAQSLDRPIPRPLDRSIARTLGRGDVGTVNKLEASKFQKDHDKGCIPSLRGKWNCTVDLSPQRIAEEEKEAMNDPVSASI